MNMLVMGAESFLLERNTFQKGIGVQESKHEKYKWESQRLYLGTKKSQKLPHFFKNGRKSTKRKKKLFTLEHFTQRP